MQLVKSVSLVVALLASLCLVQAAPTPAPHGGITPRPPMPFPGHRRQLTCPVNKATIDFPAGSTIGIPAGMKVTHITVGRGVQNYTCTNSTWTSAGAVATLYDISCLQYIPGAFKRISEVMLSLPIKNPTSDAPVRAARTKFGAGLVDPILGFLVSKFYIGDHFFNVFQGNGKNSPVFDFQKKLGKGQYIIGAKKGAIDAPAVPKTNVAWLELEGLDGKLAKEVFRVDTAGGQPPASCAVEGDKLSVDYAAKYYFVA